MTERNLEPEFDEMTTQAAKASFVGLCHGVGKTFRGRHDPQRAIACFQLVHQGARLLLTSIPSLTDPFERDTIVLAAREFLTGYDEKSPIPSEQMVIAIRTIISKINQTKEWKHAAQKHKP